MSDHLPQCWTQDMGGMKRASADSCAVCHAIKFAVADALHEYDKQTYERCAKHMRTARRESLDAAREAVENLMREYQQASGSRQPDEDYANALADALIGIDALRKDKP